MGSVSQNGHAVLVNDRGARDSNKVGSFDSNDHEAGLEESKSSVYDSVLTSSGNYAANGTVAKDVSSGYVFEVGDMVWGKVKSHPWWPGHVYSEELAPPLVRKSPREGRDLLLVAFFGDSSYGWFHPSELVPFDSNFAEKSVQTSTRAFHKAVDEALDEASRRSGLGLACMCRNKHNFRPTDAQGFFAVDVADYDPGAVYSTEEIQRARNSFQPRSALDFIRRLALEPCEHDGIDFVKNKATAMSYRKATYEEIDETYSQALSRQPGRPRGSLQESAHAKMPSKAPLSGREVFADTLGKAKNPSKPNKLKDQTETDKYLFKRRDEIKDDKVKTLKKEKRKETADRQPAHSEDPTIDAADKTNGFSEKHEENEVPVTVTDGELASRDPTPTVSITKDTNTVLESDNPGFETNTSNVGSPNPSGLAVDKSTSESKVASPDEINVTQQTAIDALKKSKDTESPVGELGSGRYLLPVKKRKIEKELISEPEEKASVPSAPVSKPPIEGEIPCFLRDLHSFAIDPFRTFDRGVGSPVGQVFLRFRSLVFQKSLNSGRGNDTNSIPPPEVIPATTGSEKVQPKPSPPMLKRAPSDRLEEISAKKKKKLGDMSKLINEAKLIKKSKKTDENRAVVTSPKKAEKQVLEPTVLWMKFPPGGSLPSINELKARFARYGPLDHSATRVYWNTLTCRVVYPNKAHAQAAHKFVTESSSVLGNTGVQCVLKRFRVSGSTDPETGHLVSATPSLQPKPSFQKPGSMGSTQITRPPSPSPLPPQPPPRASLKLNISISPPPLPPHPPSKLNISSSPPPPLPPQPPPNMDIAPQMLSLLAKCKDVVTNVTSMLGYVPYHPL